MKKLLLVFGLLNIASVYGQNVGIGTNTPLARLHVADSSVLFTGPESVPGSTNFDPPASGRGTRFMWYPQKAALRVGFVEDSNWNKSKIGLYSIALGYNGIASADYSVCIGVRNYATGLAALSIGGTSLASGEQSITLGYGSLASGFSATSIGYSNSAYGMCSISMGNGTSASGQTSTSMGAITKASGFASTSMGSNTFAIGSYSTSMGYFTIARSAQSLVIGKFNDTTNTNRLFEIGNGSAQNARSNALTVLQDGNVGIGNANPDAPLSFATNLGEKIALYPYSVNQRYGIGVTAGSNYGVLRFYVPTSSDFVSWGLGNNTAFTENMSLSGDGILRVRTSVIAPYAFAPSDLRFKRNLIRIQSSLEKIQSLNGYAYYYRTESFPEQHFNEKEQIGLIAQEVESVFPQIVNTDESGYKSVDYAKLVPVLVEAIKEQQAQIKKLEESLDKLTQKSPPKMSRSEKRNLKRDTKG